MPKKKKPKLIKLDIGCGQTRPDGWVGIDRIKSTAVDIVHDITEFPWPVEKASVEEARAIHLLEHIPGKLRFAFFDELYRVTIPGAKCLIVSPYYSSMRAVQDPTHEWPPICEASFLYFNADWRKQNLLDHYEVHCDYDFSYGYAVNPTWAARNDETRNFAVQNYVNAAMDLQVILTRRE